MKLETKSPSDLLAEMTTREIAQILAERATIQPSDWHRLKNNRQAQAMQQLAASMIYLLHGETAEALERINQAQGWLNHTINPLPCPSHGKKENN